LSWESYVAAQRTLPPGSSTGYGRRFVARDETRIGLVPVGYADGFRRGLTGAEVLVDGERRSVVGTVSMDSFAVELGASRIGAPVCLIGSDLLAEEHARHLQTINYEITCGIRADPLRADRRVVDG
jgi:alanine racemase